MSDDNDTVNGVALLMPKFKKYLDKDKLTADDKQEIVKLQLEAIAYLLQNLVSIRGDVVKLKKDNWVGVVKTYPRLSLSIFSAGILFLISDTRKPFLDWLGSLIDILIKAL